MNFFRRTRSATFPLMTGLLTAVLTIAGLLIAGQAVADGVEDPWSGYHCSRTSWDAWKACRNGAYDDYWIARGNCENLPTREERMACRHEAVFSLFESLEECGEQHEARLEVCEALGEAPYHPEINPDEFVDTIDNPYFPLTPGTLLAYEGETEDGLEHVEVLVTDETREVLGVECTVVQDTVALDGEIIEFTHDWYAQDIHGNVWYFGELSFEYEDGEIVNMAGSWEAGVDGAKPGIIMKAFVPEVGDVYRQEFFLGEAEDMGEVLGDNETVTIDYGTFDQCLMTLDTTPIEPGQAEHKFYAPGIGVILEVDLETGDQIELVEIITR